MSLEKARQTIINELTIEERRALDQAAARSEVTLEEWVLNTLGVNGIVEIQWDAKADPTLHDTAKEFQIFPVRADVYVEIPTASPDVITGPNIRSWLMSGLLEEIDSIHRRVTFHGPASVPRLPSMHWVDKPHIHDCDLIRPGGEIIKLKLVPEEVQALDRLAQRAGKSTSRYLTDIEKRRPAERDPEQFVRDHIMNAMQKQLSQWERWGAFKMAGEAVLKAMHCFTGKGRISNPNTDLSMR